MPSSHSQPEHRGGEHWGPVTLRRSEDGELHLESPIRLLSSFGGPAEQFWPASVARFNGESAEHWHQAAVYWQEKAEPHSPAPVLSEEERGLLRESATDLSDYAAERDDPDDERRLLSQSDSLRSLASREHREEENQVLRARLEYEARKLFTEALPRGVPVDSAAERATGYVNRLFDAVFSDQPPAGEAERLRERQGQ